MEEISTLAAFKNFSDLNEQERIMVLGMMTKDDYDQLHLLLRSVRSLDSDVAPSPELAARLKARMAQTARPADPLLRLLRLKIPVWQAAAVLLLALAVMQFLKTPPTMLPETPSIVRTVVKSDTVVLEKVLWKDRIVWREKPEHSPAVAFESSIENMDQAFAPKINTAPQEIVEESAKKGMPVGEQPELLQFFTQPGESGGR